MKKENKEIKLWIRLPSNADFIKQMRADMKRFSSQSAYFQHVLNSYYKLIKR